MYPESQSVSLHTLNAGSQASGLSQQGVRFGPLGPKSSAASYTQSYKNRMYWRPNLTSFSADLGCGHHGVVYQKPGFGSELLHHCSARAVHGALCAALHCPGPLRSALLPLPLASVSHCACIISTNDALEDILPFELRGKEGSSTGFSHLRSKIPKSCSQPYRSF